jgi:asparagine N-glycosylation enzyme membrane subunit Stt3
MFWVGLLAGFILGVLVAFGFVARSVSGMFRH